MKHMLINDLDLRIPLNGSTLRPRADLGDVLRAMRGEEPDPGAALRKHEEQRLVQATQADMDEDDEPETEEELQEIARIVEERRNDRIITVNLDDL